MLNERMDGSATATAFRHEALFYDGPSDFVSSVGPFLREGLDRDEIALVVVDVRKIELLRTAIGPADDVRYADMATVGRNPARIIPAWQAFVDEARDQGRGFRGVGEPIWAARSGAELAECERHEALLNVAFDGSPGWRLLCPYDTGTLPADVLGEARRNHPTVWDDGTPSPSAAFRGIEDAARPLDAPLPDLGFPDGDRPFGGDDLHAIRELVRQVARDAGLDEQRTADAILVADELASNSIRHGGGRGRVRLWRRDGSLVVEITDRGRIEHPLAGRELPAGAEGGYGLWLANQLSDLVQIRVGDAGSTVRAHLTS
jgi:anti-sigma regulatory factor (Ser/Thr protein kinase)